MLFRLAPEVLVLLLPSLLFALCFHEFSHAWMAHRLGDSTAERMGRLTLNPLAHLDPMGALMILFVGFGWAKPVPVDPRYFRDPRKGMMMVAFAGPASNLILAFISGLMIRTIYIFDLNPGEAIYNLLFFFTYINIALAAFNMIPLPPLDGSQILAGVLGPKNPELVHTLQRHGPMILLGLIVFGYMTNIRIIWWIIGPIVNGFLYIFAGL